MKRSRITTALPKRLRDQLDLRLRENGFSDYAALSAWLTGEGFQISRAALQRYGSRFQRTIEAVRLATEQAHEIALAAPDRQNDMTDALTRLVQERMFGLLVRTADISERDLPRISRAIADLARASISQRRWAEEIAARLANQRSDAERQLGEVARDRGLSAEAAEQIRQIMLGIDPLRVPESEAAA